MKIGTLKKVELRKIWSREDTDFTNWLNENLDLLGETIGLDLEESELEESKTERPLDNSDLRVDISVKTREGEEIVIENQLEKTDHKHLGQIITYMINMEAKVAIWIAKKIREEHINVINWLNEFTDKDFYLIQLESYQIDDSKPAPFFKVICRPSEEIRERGKQKKELSENNQLKINFWKRFLENAKDKTDFFVNDRLYSWTGRHNKIGKTGVELGCRVNANRTAVSIIFNPDLKDKFLNLKEDLEAEIGFVLDLSDKDRSKIGFVKSNKKELIKWFDNGGYRSPESEWNQIQEEMINHFVKLEKALKPFLKKLKPMNKVA